MREIPAKTILNKHKKRDDWFLDDYTVNPYTGCSHNCIYCYVRGSKYGVNRVEGLAVKKNAEEILEKQISSRAKKGEYGLITLSSATDPYIPLEEALGLTRRLLKIIRLYRFPVEIVTKSPLVIRDLDILKEIDTNALLPQELSKTLSRGVIVSFSFSTVDPILAGIFEPGAPSPAKRLDAMEKMHDAGLFTGACVMPVIPFLSDSEEKLSETLSAIKEHGGVFALVSVLTLYGEGNNSCRVAFFRAIEKHFPELLGKYKELYARGPEPSAAYCQKIYQLAERLCKEYGLQSKIFS